MGRVLLVDDEPSMRLLTRLLLEEQGVECEEADSGDAALAACADQVFDAMVLDHRMPGTTGIEVAGELRRRGQATPIALYTGWGSQETQERADELGIRVVPKTETEALVRWVLDELEG
jgi:CheY-like chemotaxis protein